MRLQDAYGVGPYESTTHVCYPNTNPLTWQGMADERHHIPDTPHAVTSVGNRPNVDLEFVSHGKRWKVGRSASFTVGRAIPYLAI